MALTDQPISPYLGLWPTGDLGPLTYYTSHKRKVTVAFLKAPPKTPPTWKQLLQQARLIQIAMLWRALSVDERSRWTLAGTRAHLAITGWNFFVHVKMKNDQAGARTVQRHSGLDLGY